MNVNSVENKKMIWDILHPLLPSEKLAKQKIQVFIDQTSNDLHNHRFKYNTDLVSLNKMLIGKIQNFITVLQKQQTKPQQALGRNYDKPPQNIKSKDFFEKRLRKQQENFNKMIEGPKPKKIDFSEKGDKPISTMTTLVDQTLAEREKELADITQKYSKKDVEKWIGKSQVKNIKIAEPILSNEIKPIEIKNKGEKRVSFQLDEKPSGDNSNTFLGRLKRRNGNDNKILEKIINNQTIILENQKIILDFLNKTNS